MRGAWLLLVLLPCLPVVAQAPAEAPPRSPYLVEHLTRLSKGLDDGSGPTCLSVKLCTSKLGGGPPVGGSLSAAGVDACSVDLDVSGRLTLWVLAERLVAPAGSRLAGVLSCVAQASVALPRPYRAVVYIGGDAYQALTVELRLCMRRRSEATRWACLVETVGAPVRAW